jgi:hypothetical protein
MFRRKRNEAADLDEQEAAEFGEAVDLEENDGATNAPGSATSASTSEPPSASRRHGPYDISELPDDGIGRVDLGALLMPIVDGTEVRIDIDQASGSLISATLASPTSVMQILAFAAPRSAGIWTEIREEIVESIRGNGGRADIVEGAYGPEIVADVPSDTPGQTTPTRFLGADGPRWFLRALVQGQAAATPSAEPVLQSAFGLIGVVRGDEAMAVRETLPLRLPKELAPSPEAVAEAAAESEAPAPVRLPERGPLNTETR